MAHTDLFDIEVGKIDTFMKDSTEPYDDWEYDGETLVVILDGRIVEKYTKDDLIESNVL